MNVYLQVDHWLEFSAQRLCGNAGLAVALAELDKALSLRTFLVGHALTLADISVWASLKGAFCYLFWSAMCVFLQVLLHQNHVVVFFVVVAGHAEWQSQGKSFSHVKRWFFFLNSRVPFSAVGQKYTKKNVPPTKSNVRVIPDIYFADVLEGRQDPCALTALSFT